MPRMTLGSLNVRLVLVGIVFLVATRGANGLVPPLSLLSETQQIGKFISVRKVLGNHYFVPRYAQIHYYILYFAIRVSNKTYCSEYQTPVLDEIDDLFSAKDKDVEFSLNGESLTLRTPRGKKIKARLVDEKQCSS
jgi:hypothetical protein